MTQQIPGPPPIRNILALLKFLPEVRGDTLGLIDGMFHQYGDFFHIEVLGTKQYITSNADAIHEVLVKQSGKFIKDKDYRDTQRGLARFFGSGLVTSNGDFWKRQRKLVAPAFHTRRIEAYADTINDFTLDLLKEWRDGARMDISEAMTALTLRIVVKTLFNADVRSDTAKVSSGLRQVLEYLSEMQFGFIPTWVPTPLELKGRKARQTLDEVVYRVINERRASGEDTGDLLSMLLMAEDEDGNHMTDVQVRDEVLTLLLAGHETTANTLNWTFMLLAQHPEVEAKLHQELQTVLQGRTPTLADLKQLPYLTMVIKEAQRVLPPVWMISREATEDVEINGYTIPKGSVVGVFIYGAHHNPEYWEHPEQFNPERFSPENEGRIPRFAYLPFGGGPRICIGNSFAMMEAQLILATIAQRYRLCLEPGQVVEKAASITLYPKHGLPMTLHQRQPVTPQPMEIALS
jgi:cytochrome P450